MPLSSASAWVEFLHVHSFHGPLLLFQEIQLGHQLVIPITFKP